MPSERPDVAMIAPYPRLGNRHEGSSGVASYTANLAEALTRTGMTVTVVTSRVPGEAAVGVDGGVRVRRCFDVGPRALPAAMTAARATGAPIVHLQHELFLYGGAAALPGLIGALATPRVRARRRRTVVTMHQVLDPRHIDARFTELHRVGLPPAAARMALSGVQRAIRSFADTVVVHEPAFAAVVPGAVVIPHGVESVRRTQPKAAARRQLGLDDRLVALCFGFVAPYKGLETAIGAARMAGPDVRLVVAGGPHPRLERQHRYAERLRRDNEDVVHFTGYVDDGDVAPWFTAADVVLLPYPRPHASSGALALAIAHGTPVLASPALASTCGLGPESTFDSARDLANRLLRLAVDANERTELAASLLRMRADREWHAVARRHADVYGAALAA